MTRRDRSNRDGNQACEEREPLFAPRGDGKPGVETAILASVGLPEETQDSLSRSLDELEELARTAGATVVSRFVQRRTRIVGSTYIGRGKLRELIDEVSARKVHLIIFDNDLSPAQGRNLEKALGTKVVDRSELILDIFATHARTETAKLQVELAQLEYALPRLTRLWVHLSRLGGGIGTRGPGETQLEVDRRKVRERISHLKRDLKRIDTSRQVQRKARRNLITASLVGYTNAGKSTLMNALAGSDVATADVLFSTLDTTSRVVDLGKDYRIVLSDTVGFIRKLPHGLVDSFRATLAEVAEAELLIHVVDASTEDAGAQVETVNEVLEELGADKKPTILVLNKEDLVEESLTLNHLLGHRGPGLVISAKTGEGIDALREVIRREVAARNLVVHLEVPAADSAEVARVHRVGEVLWKRFRGDRVRIRARLPVSWVERYRGKGYLVREH